ncbi:MAG: 3-dehydroquinate synthase [Candidatus Gracilibacteria bacterium]|jgi:3-dehydroquinate synthase
MELSVKLKTGNYPIFVEKNISDKIPTYLKNHKLGRKYAIITDSKLKRMYGEPFERHLKKNGIDCELFSFAEGETSKNLTTVENLAEEMIKKCYDRKDAIIALGGGVTGDMAAFLASIYMRGIPYIQIPTTLLAMVDSSIGGKTGVDLKSGKNLLGTFCQPKAIFVDLKYLKTLSLAQLRNGLAEIIKAGIIKDKKLFEFIEQNIEKILSNSENHLNKIIIQSIKIKKNVVEKDEKESNLRMILNYGHTYGHAIEKLSNYKLLHGYAVAIGMVLENRIAVQKKLLKPKTAERIKNLLIKAGLPVATMKNPGTEDIKSDKKKDGNVLTIPLPTDLGKTTMYKLQLK